MSWFAGPAALAEMGLPAPALASFGMVVAVRLCRSLGVGATIYLTIFLTVGALAT